jgi:hypothetical protein
MMIAMKRPVSTDDLRAASVHVKYEIEQLGNTYRLATNVDWWGGTSVPTFMAQTGHNAAVESFALHVRCLDDFLYAEPRDDDVSAGDWFVPGEWATIRSADRLPELQTARRRVNKDFAHLTYSRTAHGSPLWPHEEVVERFRADLFRFVDRVDQSLVCKGFKGAAWQALPWPSSDLMPIVRGDVEMGRPVDGR